MDHLTIDRLDVVSDLDHVATASETSELNVCQDREGNDASDAVGLDCVATATAPVTSDVVCQDRVGNDTCSDAFCQDCVTSAPETSELVGQDRVSNDASDAVGQDCVATASETSDVVCQDRVENDTCGDAVGQTCVAASPETSQLVCLDRVDNVASDVVVLREWDIPLGSTGSNNSSETNGIPCVAVNGSDVVDEEECGGGKDADNLDCTGDNSDDNYFVEFTDDDDTATAAQSDPVTDDGPESTREPVPVASTDHGNSVTADELQCRTDDSVIVAGQPACAIDTMSDPVISSSSSGCDDVVGPCNKKLRLGTEVGVVLNSCSDGNIATLDLSCSVNTGSNSNDNDDQSDDLMRDSDEPACSNGDCAVVASAEVPVPVSDTSAPVIDAPVDTLVQVDSLSLSTSNGQQIPTELAVDIIPDDGSATTTTTTTAAATTTALSVNTCPQVNSFDCASSSSEMPVDDDSRCESLPLDARTGDSAAPEIPPKVDGRLRDDASSPRLRSPESDDGELQRVRDPTPMDCNDTSLDSACESAVASTVRAEDATVSESDVGGAVDLTKKPIGSTAASNISTGKTFKKSSLGKKQTGKLVSSIGTRLLNAAAAAAAHSPATSMPDESAAVMANKTNDSIIARFVAAQNLTKAASNADPVSYVVPKTVAAVTNYSIVDGGSVVVTTRGRSPMNSSYVDAGSSLLSTTAVNSAASKTDACVTYTAITNTRSPVIAVGTSSSSSKRKQSTPLADGLSIKKEKVDAGYDQFLSSSAVAPPNMSLNSVDATTRAAVGSNCSAAAAAVGNSSTTSATQKVTCSNTWWPFSRSRPSSSCASPLSHVPAAPNNPVVSVTSFTSSSSSSAQAIITASSQQRHGTNCHQTTQANSTSAHSAKQPLPSRLTQLLFGNNAVRSSVMVKAALSRKVKSFAGKSFIGGYVAPEFAPPELYMPKLKRFVCPGCGDEFITKTGYLSHMERRTMVLDFQCRCKTQKWPMTFYNPCALAQFFNTHKLLPGTHISTPTYTASVLRENTPEYEMCLQALQAVDEQQAAQSKQSRKTLEKPKRGSQNSAADEVVSSGAADTLTDTTDSIQNCVNESDKPTETEAACSNAALEPPVQADVVDVPGENNVSSNACEDQSSKSSTAVAESAEIVSDSVDVATPSAFFEALACVHTKCLECDVDVKSRHELALHYAGSQSPVQENAKVYECGQCNACLPTGCALKAHSRLHSRDEPRICPECGLNFDQSESFDAFVAHVQTVCQHTVRVPAPFETCVKCQAEVVGGSAKELTQHLLRTHTVTYHKCQACPMAFATAAAAERHSNSTGHNAQHRSLCKCPLCDSVFEGGDSNPELHSHVSKHLASLAFKCSSCPDRFASSALAIEHVNKSHESEMKQSEDDRCVVCGQACSDQMGYFNHVQLAHPDFFKSVLARHANHICPGSTRTDKDDDASADSLASSNDSTAVPRAVEDFECTRCQIHFNKIETYKRHLAKHRFLENKKAAAHGAQEGKKGSTSAAESQDKPNQSQAVVKEASNEIHECCDCQQQFSSSKELEEHTASERHATNKYHMCHLCASGFADADALQNHVASSHTAKVKSHAYPCPLCADTLCNFAHQGLLTKHLHSVHKMARAEASLCARNVVAGVNNRPASSSSLSPPKSDENSTSSESADVVTVTRLFVKDENETYQCARCTFSTTDRDRFVVHVRSDHRSDVPGAVQCNECAMCFAVAPALHRHLVLIHHISVQIDDYLSQTGQSMPEAVEPDGEADAFCSAACVADPLSVKSVHVSGGKPAAAAAAAAKLNSGEASNSTQQSVSLECTVCYRVFPTVELLRSHMRVHGMAFIQGTARRKLSTQPM